MPFPPSEWHLQAVDHGFQYLEMVTEELTFHHKQKQDTGTPLREQDTCNPRLPH